MFQKFHFKPRYRAPCGERGELFLAVQVNTDYSSAMTTTCLYAESDIFEMSGRIKKK